MDKYVFLILYSAHLDTTLTIFVDIIGEASSKLKKPKKTIAEHKCQVLF